MYLHYGRLSDWYLTMHNNAFLRWILQTPIPLALAPLFVISIHVCPFVSCLSTQHSAALEDCSHSSLSRPPPKISPPPPIISLQRWTHGPRLCWWERFAESGSIYSNSTIKPTLSALAAAETTLLSQPAPRPTPPPLAAHLWLRYNKP